MVQNTTLIPMNQTAALEALVKISIPIPDAISHLTEYPWDSETDLVMLSSGDLSHVLSLFKDGNLSAPEVEDWANALECREDIGFASSQCQALLYELANPLITQTLTNARANFWLFELSHDSHPQINAGC